MNALLDRGTEATCVFAVNDVMAVGAMAALRDRGVALPSGMAVAGFDDIATLRDVTPALTTVRLPLEQLGADALEMVLQEPADQPRVRRVRGEVVIRESTPPRA
jgi:LacI family transcriptional regulator